MASHALILAEARLEETLAPPSGRDIGEFRIDPRAPARQYGRTEDRGLRHRWPFHREADNVGERLREPVIDHHPAIDPEARGRRAIGPHRLNEIERLEARGFERGADELGPPGVAGEAEN